MTYPLACPLASTWTERSPAQRVPRADSGPSLLLSWSTP